MVFKGTGHFWDGSKAQAFINGSFETTDESLIDLLKRNGYKTIGEAEVINSKPIEVNVPEVADEATEDNFEVEAEVETVKTEWQLLKEKAASLGISIRGKNKKDLTSLIKAKENQNVDR